MTREEFTIKLLESPSNSFILQLPTSYGKSYLALQKIRQWFTEDSKILIVIPRNVLINNWLDEIRKWKYDALIPNIKFTTYISFPKYCGESWDVVLLDEAHHTSERCQDAMRFLNTKHFIGLSATLKREHLYYFRKKFNPEILQVRIKDAIDNEVLPDPKILLIPMKLDSRNVNCIIEKGIRKTTNPAAIKTIAYAEKWKYLSYKGPLRITCTAEQYYNDITSLIEWYKRKGVCETRRLQKAGERLKWLAKQKENIIRDILRQLKNYRVLTFCQSIEQSETLGCPCVNSRVGTKNLERFNAKKIKHIASIDMLNEGLNPIDCKIGLFQMINSSQRISLQRIGKF